MKKTLKAGRISLRACGLPLISIAVLLLLKDNWGQLDLSTTVGLITQFSLGTWIMALICSAISFYFVAKYDPMAAGHLGVLIERKTALRSGWRATACAQLLGFGLFTGALVRWRLLSQTSDIDLLKASKLTGLVSVTFLGASTVLTCAALLLTNTGAPGAKALATLGLIAATSIVIISFKPPRLIAKLLPNTKYLLRALGFAALDTGFACLIIYHFLPNGYVDFLTLYSVFLIALTLGTMSGLPGGAGPFELCMIALLAPTDASPLLAALMAYRLVYFALPAGLAAPNLIHPGFRIRLGGETASVKRTHPIIAADPRIRKAPAEADLIVQNQLQKMELTEGGNVLAGIGTHSIVALGAPFGGLPDSTIDAFSKAAAARNRSACFYKCDARTASVLRRKHWKVLQFGADAKLNPVTFDPSDRSFRQLRRKLRKAEKRVTHIDSNTLSYAEALPIDTEWQARSGGAHGFSVGRLTEDLFQRQLVISAKEGSEATAFITFSRTDDRWLLDLIRSKPSCADGTIHLLVLEAIKLAKQDHVACLDLGTAPFANTTALVQKRIFEKSSNAKGLHQFKQSFAPLWAPVYIAAPSWNALGLAALDIWQMVHVPVEDQKGNAAVAATLQDIHNDYGNYEFASARIS